MGSELEQNLILTVVVLVSGLVVWLAAEEQRKANCRIRRSKRKRG